MKAVQVTKPSNLVVTDVPEPGRGADVVVRSGTVGICGTDVKVFKGAIPVSYPRVMGHEMVGEVVFSPPGATVQPGDRVLIDPGSSCGTCHLCRKGRSHLCGNAGLMGREIDGVFAEFVAVPEKQIIPIPASIEPRSAGLLQVLGTCIHAQQAVTVFPGQTAAVVGLGVAGQLMVQLLTQRGIRVVGITRSEWKRDLAARTGAVATAGPDDAARVLAEVTGGRGPELVVEAAGTEQTLSQSIELAAVGGEVVVFGTLTGGDRGLPYYQLYFKELTLYNPRAALPADYALGVELAAAGRLQLDPIVSHELTLDDADEAFRLVHDPDAMKVLMHVG